MLLRLKQLCFCTLVIFGLTACDRDDKVELTADQDTINKQIEPVKVSQPTTSPETIEPEAPTQNPEMNTSPQEDTDTAETIAKTKAEAKLRIEETLSTIEDNMEDMDDETKAIFQNVRERAYEMIENMDEN